MTTSNQHTPGPWHQWGHSIIGADANHNGRAVAKVGDYTPAINQANALLIAAAPDLLATCEAALADQRAPLLHERTRAMARAAIAKAKGTS